MNPYKQLQELVGATSKGRTLGKVTQVGSSEISIIVNGHPRTYPRSFLPDVGVGDDVSLQGDVLIGKVARSKSPNTYYV